MDKRKLITLVAAALTAGLAFGGASAAYAAPTDVAGRPGLGPRVRMGLAIRDAGGTLVDVVADLTGLDPKEVIELRESGESFGQIAEDNGSSADEVLDQALEIRKELLDAKVADGTITQAQADAIYERMAERLAERVGSTETGRPGRPGWAPPRGRGRGRG